ncbi:MAG TPA: TolC family protein [Elusimicrobiota bacterium]|nr:TolC family protein [Elusimicrobiota bacterium]
MNREKRSAARIWAAPALALAALFFVRPAAGEALTPSMAAADALAHSPGLRAARADVRSADAAVGAALTRSLPRLSADASAVRSDNPVYAFGSLLEQGRFSAQDFAVSKLNQPGYLTNISGSLNLDLPVFTGFELEHGLELAHLGLSGSEIAEEGQAQGVRYEALAACLRVFFDEALIGTLDERIASSEKEVADAQKLEEKGLILGSDYYAAQAILGQMRARLVGAQGDLSSARSSLAVLTGADAAALSLSGGLGHAGYAPASEQDLIEEALSVRPIVREAALAAQAAEIKRRGAQDSFLPRLDAFASLQTNTPDFSSSPSNRMIGVQASLPFGDPTYFFRQNQARAEVDSSRARQAAAEEAVRSGVSQAYEAYQTASQSLPVLSLAVAQAQKSLELFRPLYREGRQSIMEVLRAENAAAQAQEGYAQALYGAQMSYARLLLSAGKLNGSAVDAMSANLEAKP